MSRFGRDGFIGRKAIPWLVAGRKRDRHMLGFIFGLNTRLGRLHYFLAAIVLAVVMTGLCFLVALSVLPTLPRGAQPTFEMMKWPVIGLGTLFGVISLTLQSMRIRDIGWDPVCVIPTWIAVLVVDFAVARKFPGLSLGPEHYGTVIGGLLNLVMTLALLFWPSGDLDGSAPDVSWSAPSRGNRAAPAAVDRIARVTNRAFGRRTF
jgi:uncharacterized membrane protein YhaH (DUF805 family)